MTDLKRETYDALSSIVMAWLLQNEQRLRDLVAAGVNLHNEGAQSSVPEFMFEMMIGDVIGMAEQAIASAPFAMVDAEKAAKIMTSLCKD